MRKGELGMGLGESSYSQFQLIPHSAFRIGIVCQFHHVIEAASGFITADMEQSQLAGMLSRDLLEPLDAFKFALEGAVILEGVPSDNLHPAEDTGGAARQPDLPISAPANAAQEFIVVNGRRSNCFPEKARR